jgi:hypothetical protein
MDSREISWSDVAARLAPSHSYWLATTAPDGAPHTVPVWGAVVSDTVYVYSERRTAKARNIAHDSRVVLHLPDALDVLIVHGTLIDEGRPEGHADVMAALDLKYADPADRPYLPSADPDFDVMWSLDPTRAMTWRLADWDGSHARWSR